MVTRRNDLKSRGLKGEALKLFIVDGNPRLHCYSFPEKLRRTIRTTNILEWAFREIRRKARPMGVFTNAESAEGITVGLTRNLNATWEDHPIPNE